MILTNDKYVNIKFNNENIVHLYLSSFLFKYSNYLQAFDNITDLDNIYVLCNSSYILDENNKCYFNEYNSLMFIFTLPPDKFINICIFLDLIDYDNNDINFTEKFIFYVMKNNIDLNNIHVFMNKEKRDITNYRNNIDVDIQIRVCTPIFYDLYLIEYKEEVLKNNRNDIFDFISNNKSIMIPVFFKYAHKYDNQLTQRIKCFEDYNKYIIDISKKLINAVRDCNLDMVKQLINDGADINYQYLTNTNIYNSQTLNILWYACSTNNFEIIKYLVEQGADINYTGNLTNTYQSVIINDLNFVNFKYLVDNGADINTSFDIDQLNVGCTNLVNRLLYDNKIQHIKYIVEQYNFNMHNIQICNVSSKTKLKIIKYSVEHGADINFQDNNGNTILHNLCNYSNKNIFKIIKYVIELGINVNVQDKFGNTALHYATKVRNNLNIIKYLIEHGADIYINNYGYFSIYTYGRYQNINNDNTCFTESLIIKNNTEVIKYLNSFYNFNLQEFLNHPHIQNQPNAVDNLLNLGCVLQRV